MTTSSDPFSQFLADEGGGFNFGNFSSGGGDFGGDFGIFDEFRELNPEVPFFGSLQREYLTPNQQEFFQTPQQRSPLFNQFQGSLDQLLQAGQVPGPNDTFTNFVNQPNFFQEQFRDRPGQNQATPFTNVRVR